MGTGFQDAYAAACASLSYTFPFLKYDRTVMGSFFQLNH